VAPLNYVASTSLPFPPIGKRRNVPNYNRMPVQNNQIKSLCGCSTQTKLSYEVVLNREVAKADQISLQIADKSKSNLIYRE